MPVVSGSGTGASILLASFVQTAGTNATTTSASLADVDATNAAITFAAPSNGIVIVKVCCAVNLPAAVQNCFLGLREATTNVAGPIFCGQGNATFNLETLVNWEAKITGIAAGSHTYKLAFSVNGGATFIIRQIASSATTMPVTMEVWSA